MSKLQEIETALLSINEAVFQNLCDAFLFSQKMILQKSIELAAKQENRRL